MAPDARRAAILDAAQRLFAARGWDAVTIAEVLAESGISKGGFYHHFAAKEDLLEGIVARMTEQALAAAEAAADDGRSGDAVEHLNAFIAASSRWKAENAAEMCTVAEAMSRPGNDVVLYRIGAVTARIIGPVLREMIERGAREGAFDVVDPNLTVEAIVNLSQVRREVVVAAMGRATVGDVDAAVSLLDARMRAEGALLERLLGLPPGRITPSHPEEHRRLVIRMAATAETKPGS